MPKKKPKDAQNVVCPGLTGPCRVCAGLVVTVN